MGMVAGRHRSRYGSRSGCRSFLACAVLALPGLLTPTAVAQRLGSEFQANTYTNGAQNYPSVAVGATGDFVIVWSSAAQDGQDTGVFGRRFASAGVALGSEFQVNTYTNNTLNFPSVAAAASGDFLVAWQSLHQDGPVDWGVFAKRFSNAGAALASEFQVNTNTVGNQSLPRVAALAAGNFVVAWTSFGQDGSEFGVFARRVTSSGAALGE